MEVSKDAFNNLSPAALNRFNRHLQLLNLQKDDKNEARNHLCNRKISIVSPVTNTLDLVHNSFQKSVRFSLNKKLSLQSNSTIDSKISESTINSIPFFTQNLEEPIDYVLRLLDKGMRDFMFMTTLSVNNFNNLDTYKFLPTIDLNGNSFQFSFTISNLKNVLQFWISELTTSFSSKKDGLALKSFRSSGRSGAKFYTTADKRFLFKEIRSNEIKSLRNHFFKLNMENRLLPELICIVEIEANQCEKAGEKAFLLMQNVFYDDELRRVVRVKEIYDLKGSILRRKTDLERVDHSRKSLDLPVLKDLNLSCTFKVIDRSQRLHFLESLVKAVNELKSLNVMDYSLLIGVLPEADSHEYIRSYIRRFSAEVQGKGSILINRAYSMRSNSVQHLSTKNSVHVEFIKSEEVPRNRDSSTFIRRTCHKYFYQIFSNKKSWTISRRFNDFKRLENNLKCEIENLGLHQNLLPSLPEKKGILFMDKVTVFNREKKLLAWLKEIISIVGPNLSKSIALSHFLTNSMIQNKVRHGPNIEETGLPDVKLEAYRMERGTKQEKVTLYVGLIDVLQQYTINKKVENLYKRMMHSPQEISAINSEKYGDRFLSYIKEFVII